LSEQQHIVRMSARIIRTFQHYAHNIDPNDELFINFITRYVAEKGAEDPRKVAYSELYKVVKAGIREYLAQRQPKQNSHTK